MVPVALTIAGSDPGGGAGIQADLKTFHRFGVYGEAVITMITVQNTLEVSRIKLLKSKLVMEQLEAVLTDIPPVAAKTGALGSMELVHLLSEQAAAFRFPLVVDPVMVSKHGTRLLDREAVESVRHELLPHTFLMTPNLAEAALLTGRAVATMQQMKDAAHALCDDGAHAALVKGGHLQGQPIDILYTSGEFHEFAAERIATGNTHGTGCAYSAAITAGLAHGRDLITAITEAKNFVTRAILSNPKLGGGNGPLNFFA